MTRQIRRKAAFLWIVRLLLLSCLATHGVVSWGPTTPLLVGKKVFLGHVKTSSRACDYRHDFSLFKLHAKYEEDDDENFSSPSSRPTRKSKGPPSRSRQPQTSKAREDIYDEYYDDNYYEEDYYEEEDDLPFQEPVRPLGKYEKLARYESQRKSIENDMDEYDDDEDYYDDEDGDDDEDSAGGNFWSNPSGGVDRSVKPPKSPAARRAPRVRGDDYDPRPRRRTRSPIRSSSMSSAPEPFIDLYERLFWYGFDPGESEGVSDKTVFGGTKGKFNGLSFLKASEMPGRSIEPRRKQQRRLPPRSRDGEFYSDDGDDLDEDEYEYGDDQGDEFRSQSVAKSKRSLIRLRNQTPPTDFPGFRDEKKGAPAPRQSPQRSRRVRPKPRARDYEDDDYGEGVGGDWVSKQVSAWFSGNDDDDDDRAERPSGRRDRRRQRATKTEWSPFSVLDTFLGLDREDMAYKAEMYNAKMGIGPKSAGPRRRSNSSSRQQRRDARDNPRRPGYAYRYNSEDDMDDEDASFVVDIEPPVPEEASARLDGKEAAIDDEDTMNGSGRRDLSWEERALAVERVPPAKIPGWGPSGELPVDGRTKAILDALEDIQTARQKLEAKEKKEALAKEDITILKVDAEMQRRQLEESRSNARAARERLRQIELEIDDASRALRRARTQVQLARDQLEELQGRHWAVLASYNPDQAEEQVAEALNAFRLSEPTGWVVDGPNTVSQAQAAVSQEDNDSTSKGSEPPDQVDSVSSSS